MNPKVDLYLSEGCGRCPLGNTPQCKVNPWQEELKALRRLVLECGLVEEVKWGVPCYTFDQGNVLMVTCFKDFACLSFFKGTLLKDTDGLLSQPGKNSQAVRLIRFTKVSQIVKQEATLKAYIFEAIGVQRAGLKVAFKKNPAPVPEELQMKLDEMPELKVAFEALTPGRQRGYILHFSQPKQSKTRTSRIEKCIPKILEGKGMHDGYSKK